MKNNKWLKLSSAFIILPAVLFLSVYSLDQKGFFQIDQIRINAATSESQRNFIAPKIESLKNKLGAFKGVSLWRFPLNQVAEILQQEAWIKDYRLSRSWPSSLEVEIEPQAVAFLIQSTEGKLSSTFNPVSQSGEVLAAVDSKEAPNAIISHDAVFLKNKKIRDGALNVLKSLPTQGRLHPSQVSEIGYDKKEGYWIRLVQSQMKINLGEDQFEIKTARVTQVMDYLETRDLKARVIDANLSKKVLVRLH